MPERMKAYHSEWSDDSLVLARGDGIVIDDGEAWKYQYSHMDASGKYDLWYRQPNPLDEDDQNTALRDHFAGQAMLGFMAEAYAGIHKDEVPRLAAESYYIADAMMKERESK